MAGELSGFSKALRRLRQLRGMSQERLAELTGIHQRTISRMENTATEGYLPPPHQVVALARALDVSVAELVREAGYPIECDSAREVDLPALATFAERWLLGPGQLHPDSELVRVFAQFARALAQRASTRQGLTNEKV
uniref:XRE family transcriptional regulator n=1 Tax=Thermorudis sp. TaxID=1969470 RepID=A0A7C2WSB2_9BACT